jgi:hypothetical protein
LNLFVEIGKMKKPEIHSILAGKMLCKLVSLFREVPNDEEFL